MSKPAYIPDRGDVIWVILDPRVGHEQSGKRPAIVLSRRLFSERTGLAVICPITSKVKGFSFEIRIKDNHIDGAILPIHIRSIDVRARQAAFIEKAPATVLGRVLKTVEAIVSL